VTDPSSIRFGIFELDLEAGELRRNGSKIRLQEQPFQILVSLLERPGKVVTRDELRKKLWPADTFVDFDHGLNAAIRRLREALDDSAETPRFVETVARRGYRFIGPVDVPLAPAVGPSEQVPSVAAAPSVGQPVRASSAALLVVAKRQKFGVAVGVFTVLIVLGVSFAWYLTHRPPSAPLALKERRLTASASENPVTQGVISPDGKYLAYGDQRGLHLKLIPTGEITNIPQPPGVSAGQWWPNAWFPDGTKFITAGFELGQELPSAWVVSVIGGLPRKLRDDADPWSVSPDGALIAFGTGDYFHGRRDIWVMGPQGEEPRRLVSQSGVSYNAGVVKYFFPTLLHPLRDERHFALVEISAIPTKARS
jgi:DNA-binding winged helix-turn-helix (wHTH) protein